MQYYQPPSNRRVHTAAIHFFIAHYPFELKADRVCSFIAGVGGKRGNKTTTSWHLTMSPYRTSNTVHRSIVDPFTTPVTNIIIMPHRRGLIHIGGEVVEHPHCSSGTDG